MERKALDAFLDEYTETLLPEKLAGRFDTVEVLGSGDFGDTLLLTDKNTTKLYVLKSYNKSVAGNDINEAEILQGLSHPGLPAFEEKTEDGDVCYVLREYTRGIPLSEYIDECGGSIGVKEAVGIAISLCDILTYLHTQNPPIIHRDVKPSNIIINTEDNNIKLIDFGISRRYVKDLKHDTMYYGTKNFSPPEQYGFSQTDSRTDIYALGVVLRVMLTGDVDGVASNKALSKIINKCTAFSPGSRYKSAAAVKRDLLKYNTVTGPHKPKILVAALTVCFIIVTGFCVGRYTDLFRSAKENTPDLSAPPSGNLATETDNPSGTASPAPGQQPPPAPVVVFTEPLIEKAVLVSLGKTENEPIFQNELKSITEIYVCGLDILLSENEYHSWWKPEFGTINSLDDFCMLENLRVLFLRNQPVFDLSPLAGCLLLDTLSIDGSPVSDISALENLPGLHKLCLVRCNITDLSQFGAIRSLTELTLGFMPLEDFLGLNAYHLELLDLSGTYITSLDGIERFTRLRNILFASTDVTDFSILDSMPNLRRLEISYSMEKYLDTLTRDDLQIVLW